MQRNYLLNSALVVGISIVAYLLDFTRVAMRQYTTENFNMALAFSSLIISRLVFAAIAVWAVIQIRELGFSPVAALIIPLGFLMVAIPFTDIRPLTTWLPYGEFSSITGSLWIVLGVLSLFGRKIIQGSKP